MNRKMIAYLIARMLFVVGALMLLSVLTGILYGEKEIWMFLPSILLCIAAALLFGRKKPENTSFYAREGFFVVGMTWIVMSLIGALPLYFTGQFNTYIDAVFEIVSGFTTTGASVLVKPELMPYCVVFWRSFSHWIGGMGVLVFVLAIMPMSEERSLHLMRAEVPGPVVGKLVPKMRETAKILYSVYAAMTVILIILLVFGGMSVFDASCYAFATAGTGGFSTSSSSIAGYGSAYIEIVLSIFMLLFGVNFNLYYLILIGKIKSAFSSEELHTYLGVVFAAIALISVNTLSMGYRTGEAIRNALFQVSSIVTTTGFATVDFNLWPGLSKTILLLLMVIGAMAGSTGGGIKVSRVIILFKTAKRELKRIMHPRQVPVARFEGSIIDEPLMHGTLVYCAFYMIIICVSVFLISFDGFDVETNISAVLACFNNIGPGLGEVGPMSTYINYSLFSKIVLTIGMLLGRLEIYPMLILFTPAVWKKK